MKRRVIASLLTLVLCLTLLPAPAFAEEIGGTTPEPAATDIYVSSAGDDTDGDGSAGKPYATLLKAVTKAKSGATIYVMSDLTMTECARYYDKDLTITSLDPNNPVTISRGTEFDTQNDPRSWYNPALIEVQTKGEAERCGLILHHIILDDKGLHEGSIFAQASSGSGTDQIDNTTIVQDAMIASNATVPCTITLGEGAVLRNFGGMSAVRVTERAELVMKFGSKIEDTPVVKDRIKGNAKGEVGPAGAVWLQGSDFEMKSGAEIKNVNGRAIYADGGEVTVGGTISGITGNPAMWQGEYGTAIHLRNKASGTLLSGGVIKEISGTGSSAVYVHTSTLNCNKESKICGCDSVGILSVYCDSNWNDGRNIVSFDGELSGTLNNKNPFQIACTDLTIGKNAKIHGNSAHYGALYLQKNVTADIYGKIYENTASGRGGGIGTAGHGFVEINLYDGAEIKDNIANNTGGGLSLKNTKFVMQGGEISSNCSKNNVGGGVFLYEDAVAELRGGTISSNTDKNGSNDITITHQCNSTSTNNYLAISNDATIGNKAIYFEKDTKTVTPAADSLDIKLGNASTDSNTALKNASTNDKDWANPLATFWVQRDGAASLTVGGLKLNADQQRNTLPVYVLTQKTGDDGKPASSDAPINTYAAAVDADGNVRFTLPAADVNGYGCAVAIVQPTQDFGKLTISGPETIKQNKTDADYPVAYTVTYVMSESLKNIITQAGGSANYSLVITKDARLTGNPGSFDGNSIQVTYTLPNNAFVVGDSLFASAELTVTVGGNRYVIPSNVTKTKLLGLESFHVVFDWNEGSGKTETVSVTEGEALGNAMIADPSRRGYTFTGWNTQQDGKGSSFDNSTVITGPLTVYAQWSENSSGGGGDGSKTYYYFAIEKVDAQDGSVLSSAKFGLFLDGKQIATAASNRSGIAMFRVNASDYRKINAKSDLYYQELTAPEGYVVNSDEVSIEKSNLTTSWSKAEKDAETVRNYRGSTPDLLNGDDHFAYVVGYQDGCVHPNALITRAETATIFFRLLKDDVRDDNLRTSNTFADVPNDYWANTAISTMAGLGIVQGRSSTAFDPNASITRAEFAAICARFDTGKSSGTQTFSDIKGHWAQSYIERAAELGWIKGFEDGTFRPNDCITRAQAMTMINRVLNRIPEDASDLLPDMNVWPDCNPGDWFYLAVQEATNSHNYKHKAGNYETWISMKQDPDWTRYEN